MRKLNSILAVATFFGMSAAALAANPGSDTIPTSQLVAYFSVSATSAGNTVALAVEFIQAYVTNGQLNAVALDQSSDDVVTFSQGSNTVTYNPSNTAADVLPYTAGATYTMTLKRFNGETYTATAPAPGLATYTQPSAGQSFEKTDAVTLDWTAPASAQPAMFALGSNCGTVSGDISFNDSYTSATVPASYAASCSGAVQMEFDSYYVTGGAGFGGFSGVSEASILYSYGATLPTTTVGHHGLSVNKILAALRNHQKFMKYTF
jgi:hypothetical protein